MWGRLETGSRLAVEKLPEETGSNREAGASEHRANPQPGFSDPEEAHFEYAWTEHSVDAITPLRHEAQSNI
jgi:hypothetical protein